MSAHTEAKHLCYVTMNPQHAVVREHIRAGGRACALEAGVNGQMITLYDKGRHIPLMWTHLIPATLEGRAMHNVQNAMFAAAMAFSLDASSSTPSARACAPSTHLLPGAGAHERLRRAPVQGDLRLRPQRARRGRWPTWRPARCAGRRIVVVAGPGDRRDEDIRDIARAVAGRFDHYICRRDDGLRGRAWRRGAADDRRRAAQRRAWRDSAITIIPDEQQAIDAALRMGAPGDLLLSSAIFADALTRSWKQVIKFKPDAALEPRHTLGRVPVALVTGSNGKTTTVRLVAAMLARAGHVVGFCCSDGVFIDGRRVERGDWSGPAGARRVLRDPRVTAAVLETARGGILRRGLACPRADAALITNIAEDHLGGYGIESLGDLAEVKLVVVQALRDAGTLVLNADDVLLRTTPHHHHGPIAWFKADEPPAVLPPPAEMPLTLGGAARHNVSNLAGAAVLATLLGAPAHAIRAVASSFGAENDDNPGRLERFERGGVRIWIDYAHNPHGLGALLAAAAASRGTGRLGLLLGQAGDRDDDAIRALARTAWDAAPDRIVLKDLDGYLRGRERGDVPALLRAELLESGARAEQIDLATDETDGVRRLLAWARPGDLLVLPVHALEARERAIQLVQNWT
jgi:UDP-N-acetylmuramyl tripeptide synthase